MRPNRLYKTDTGRYYFIIDGKRKYIKIPKDITEKEILQLNIKTILKLYGEKRRKKRARKRKIPLFEKPILNGDIGKAVSASSAFFEEGKPITQISDITSGKLRKSRTQFLDDLSLIARSTVAGSVAPFSSFDARTASVGPLQSDVDVGSSVSQVGSQAGTPLSSFSKIDLLKGVSLGQTRTSLRNPTIADMTKDKIQGLTINIPSIPEENLLKEAREQSQAEQRKREIERANKLSLIPKDEFDFDLQQPEPPQRLKGVEAQESKNRIRKILREVRGERSDVMPSLRVKPQTTAEKIANTPSFSSTMDSNRPAGAMAISIAEQVRNEMLQGLSPEDQAKAQMGFGEGLYNDEISKIIKKSIGEVIPVIASDEVNNLLNYVSKGDKKFGAVINTNPSSSDGSGKDGYRPGHWRAVFIDNEDDYLSVEYFDPLSEGDPEKELLDVLKKIAKKMNPEKMFLLKINNIRRQSKESSTCGWHVSQFLDDRFNGVPFSEASGYDHYINSLPVIDGSVEGEADVKKYIKKYKVFI